MAGKILDYVDSVEAPLGPEFGHAFTGPVRVVFRNTDPAFLDSSDPLLAERSETLRMLSRYRRPAYTEIQEGTRIITNVLIPRVGHVLALNTHPDQMVRVTLDCSAAFHFVSSNEPSERDFLDRLAAALETGMAVAVAADIQQRHIVDVEPPPRLTAVPTSHQPPPTDQQGIIKMLTEVTMSQAASAMERIRSQSCRLPDTSSPCLPLLFPDDYCWATAHQICKTLAKDHIVAGKVWLFGQLEVRTPNKDNCVQQWAFHVAALVKQVGNGDQNLLVLDPIALPDDGVAPLDEWRSLLNGTSATMIISEMSAYRMTESGQFGIELPGLLQEDLDLARAELRQRCGSNAEPPPYSQCLHSGTASSNQD